ncbi:MAG: hypothetical protein R3301_00520 [Saprospiraceae bacterium]|nr:hypothetical protein [Saprospiraceae bacterium]
MRFLITLSVFLALSAVATAQTSPCACCAAEYRQFDFWLGYWEAFTPAGQLAGTNDIVLLQDSCIVQENWVSAGGGFTGTSYNYYDRQRRLWNQVWIDNQGGSLVLQGRRAGNQMILSGTSRNQNGDLVKNRVTWTANEDGTVRQLWETSADGTSWSVAFDGLYKRKGKE